MERFRSRCQTSQTATKCYFRQWKITIAKVRKALGSRLANNSIFSNRHVREFNDEYSKTRIFSHQNILPALGTVNKPEVIFYLLSA